MQLLPNEQIKDIQGYEGLYAVTSFGRVWSYRTKKFLTNIDTKGYKSVQFWIKNAFKSFLVHRLVAKAFIPNPKDLPDVNHKNGKKSDNSLDNLEWATESQNSKHAFDNGLAKGSRGIIRKHNTSGFVGVSKSKDKWQAYILHNGKKKNLGTYKCRLAAAYAYDRASLIYHGDTGKLNFKGVKL